ncbi:GTPase IMAP family member 8-like [Seriola lalandi dorsalis]|uniref:GTPase IMAP family member 8-like n=1 Tax=Seriola lalandi dorsalis TaxID=1841481 RepID=UPI000C6FACFD|nr:GTPase IMAP family member 8-like [Seriola lalandi dorsalis]
MSNQSRTSEVQVKQLFEKIQKMMEVNKRPREIQNMMYTQLRRDVSMRVEERRWQGRVEDIEMTVMGDVRDRRSRPRRQISSKWQQMSRGFSAEPVVFKPALGLILLGRRKSGKSSAGNLILDREEFQTNIKTTRCSVGYREVSGWSVTVVDTPGWSLFGLANPEQVRTEISLSPSLCPVRSRVAFLLAVPVDSFREKDRRAVETYLSVLGDNVWRSSVVLFTYGEVLRGKAIQKHIEGKGEPLQWVLDRCGRRHHVFHTGDETEVTQLMQKVARL